MKIIRQLFGYRSRQEVRDDQYRAGQDYMAKLLDKYPEQLAYEQAHKVERDPSNYFDAGVLDYIEHYKSLQKGKA